jgi:hypothetical protein
MSDFVQAPFYWEQQDDSWVPETIDPALLLLPTNFEFSTTGLEAPAWDNGDFPAEGFNSDWPAAQYDFFFALANL